MAGADGKTIEVPSGNLTELEQLRARVAAYNPRADLDRLEQAYRCGERAHRGQKRASGADFIDHPLAVARILADLELDEASIIAALLHDTVEDTGLDLAEIEAQFGPEVSHLVDGVTKLNRLHFKSRLEEQAENLRKMFLAMADDIRVVLIKLADRLHNMRTLEYVDEEKRRAKARETLEIYAPLAHRLGISRIQWELEDLSLKFLEPERYRELARSIPQRRREREELLERLISFLKVRLQEVGIEADIQGRAKHLYSIYRKVHEQGKDLREIYDLVAVRVIVETVKDCYGALGVVHTLWRPLPGRFKDFIATPKSNMYQSLHTTVIGPSGQPFEVQIRTREMHRTAEYGIAAHWRYKEGSQGDRESDAKFAWLRQILEWQSDMKDAREFMESLKIDLFSDEVFVFTPKGDVVELPAGASPIDFAYRIHTEVGHRCVGARINGRIASLDTQLQNGDIVEILTNAHSAGPSPDWLGLVKTSTARNRIRQHLKRLRREENMVLGREALEREARSQGLQLSELWRQNWVDEVCRKFGMPDEESLLVSIGFGALSSAQVITKFKEIRRRKTRGADATIDLLPTRRFVSSRDPREAVQVKGIDNVLVRFARCCNPVPGDPIMGYITRGRGVSIHRSDCKSFQSLSGENRRIEVTWDHVHASYYPVHTLIYGIDRPGLLSDVAQLVAETRTNILSAKARACRDGTAVIDLVIEVRSLEQFEFLRGRMEKVDDVLGVERVNAREEP